jgi:hypothetical protein
VRPCSAVILINWWLPDDDLVRPNMLQQINRKCNFDDILRTLNVTVNDILK